MIKIRPYRKRQDTKLLDLLLSEGDMWAIYSAPDQRDLYFLNCEKSLTYLLYEEDEVIGYIRAIEDYSYYIYILDLLVRKDKRGHGYGKLLIEHIQHEFPNLTVFVMSDEDDYYIKQGYHKVGSIFEVK
ncbi:MAG: N-acetyltransferase [Acholeplasma sp.]|jgi:GNAT superfamily N-acetyltransferase|nr:MAG: N-acetyltransferase [Acholeplasma sp.]